MCTGGLLAVACSCSQKSGFGGTPKPQTPMPRVTSFGSSIIIWYPSGASARV